jgi:hypothetical protein
MSPSLLDRRAAARFWRSPLDGTVGLTLVEV